MTKDEEELARIRAERSGTPYEPITSPTGEPVFKAESFICPHCQTFALQRWSPGIAMHPNRGQVSVPRLSLSFCDRCQHFALWVDGQVIYPTTSSAPQPISEMPDNVKADYLEASTVVGQSPRSAAALLRLALQKLMVHLGEKGENINTDIGNLVKKGLPVAIQKALDTVRVIGNNAVHPGQIDITDDRNTAHSLFRLLNFIVERTITELNKIDNLYSVLPQNSRDAIDKRDGKA